MKPIKLLAAIALLGLGWQASADHDGTPTLSVTSDTACTDLLAGQTIDAGDVCFSIENNDTLVVTYTTTGGWELTEAHLWVGNTESGYPQTKKGNPKVGNFPYNSGEITGATSHSFSVPIGDITALDLADLHNQCGLSDTLYAMAHAAVQKDNGDGTFQTETGWGNGPRVMDKGSWATRSVIDLVVECGGVQPCEETNTCPTDLGQETAFMIGDYALNSAEYGSLCGETDDTVTNAWGWQTGLLDEGVVYSDLEIWAAAGQNDTSKGTLVGHVLIDVGANSTLVVVEMMEGFEAVESHIHVGNAPACTRAVGQWEPNQNFVTIDAPVYVGVHLSVEAECQLNGNFCDGDNTDIE